MEISNKETKGDHAKKQRGIAGWTPRGARRLGLRSCLQVACPPSQSWLGGRTSSSSVLRCAVGLGPPRSCHEVAILALGSDVDDRRRPSASHGSWPRAPRFDGAAAVLDAILIARDPRAS